MHTKAAQTTNIFRVNIKYANKVLQVSYLSVYMTRPLLHSLRSRLGVVIQWASDLREFLKKVSGIQILPTMLLLSMSSFIELLNFNRLSYHVWAKKMSMVYSCKKRSLQTLVSIFQFCSMLCFQYTYIVFFNYQNFFHHFSVALCLLNRDTSRT